MMKLALLLFLISSSIYSRSICAFVRPKVMYSLDLKLGRGIATSNEELIYKARTVYSTGAEAAVAYNAGFYYLGFSIDFTMWHQFASVKQFQTNVSGNQFSYSPVLGFNLGRLRLDYRPVLISTMTLDRPSVSNQVVQFSRPTLSSSKIKVVFDLNDSYMGVEMNKTIYQKIAVGVDATSLNSDRVSFQNIGFIYGLRF